MLRWSMIFDTRTGMDYLNQLRGLGAILAIPTGADGKDLQDRAQPASPGQAAR